MATNRVFRSILLAASVLLMAACANDRPPGSLEEKYFQAEAKNYEKFQHEGETVYCSTKESPAGQGYFPYMGYPRCISEANLRQAVRDMRRDH